MKSASSPSVPSRRMTATAAREATASATSTGARAPSAARIVSQSTSSLYAVGSELRDAPIGRAGSQGRVSRFALVLSAAFCVVGAVGAVGSWVVYRMDGAIARDGERADGQ